MTLIQKEISLQPRHRGFHLVTSEILTQLPELKTVSKGILHVFIKHTSASLTLNENADPSVRTDFETFFTETISEHAPYFKHNTEGSDDMPAHLKASILGNSVSIPVTDGNSILVSGKGSIFVNIATMVVGVSWCLL